eukprot:gene17783-27396_t
MPPAVLLPALLLLLQVAPGATGEQQTQAHLTPAPADGSDGAPPGASVADAEDPYTYTPEGEDDDGTGNGTLSIPRFAGQDRIEKLKRVATGAVAVAAVVGAAAAAPGMTLLLLLDSDCDGDLPELNWLQHPTQLEIGDSFALGIVAGNAAVFCIVAMLTRIIALVLSSRGMHEGRSGVDMHHAITFPSAPYYILLLLYQGTALGALFLVFSSSDGFEKALGITVSVVLLALPGWVVYRVPTAIPTEGAGGKGYYYAPLTAAPTKLTEAFLGAGEWVSTAAGGDWVQRHRAMVVGYSQACTWFSIVEVLAMGFTAGVVATAPEHPRSCGHGRLLICLCHLGVALFIGRLKPYCKRRDNICHTARFAVQGLASGCLAVAFYEEHNGAGAFDVASVGYGLAVAIFVVTIIADIVSEGWVFMDKRREKLQDAARAAAEKAAEHPAALLPAAEHHHYQQQQQQQHPNRPRGFSGAQLKRAPSTPTGPRHDLRQHDSHQGGVAPRAMPPLARVPSQSQQSSWGGQPAYSPLPHSMSMSSVLSPLRATYSQGAVPMTPPCGWPRGDTPEKQDAFLLVSPRSDADGRLVYVHAGGSNSSFGQPGRLPPSRRPRARTARLGTTASIGAGFHHAANVPQFHGPVTPPLTPTPSVSAWELQETPSWVTADI